MKIPNQKTLVENLLFSIYLMAHPNGIKALKKYEKRLSSLYPKYKIKKQIHSKHK